MWYRRARGVVIACGVAAALLATPAESRACLDWLFGGCGARTTYSPPYAPQTYAPVYSAPACASCAPACASCAPACASCAPACVSCAPQTVNYVPQTYYRTVYRMVPVTSYSTLTGCDACTGCPVTYYRPVTSWTFQPALVPYTSYRLVYSNPCGACVGGSPCWSCGPSAETTFAPSSGCCAPAATEAPSAGTQPPAGTSNATQGQAPTGTSPPTTFKKGSESPGESAKPVPDPNMSSSPGPNLPDPNSRTTFRPAHPAAPYRLIASPPQPAMDYRPPSDDGGWRVSRD
jgi:hypothetical protein